VGQALPHSRLRGSGPLVTTHCDTIVASLLHGAFNARVESVNTRLRLLPRIAFGFRSTDALIGLAMLALAGLCPPLPGR
jgi:transposase